MGLQQFGQTLLSHDLQPILSIVTIVARFMGIGFIIVGLSRLYKAANQTMMYRTSPLVTMMYFLIGAMVAAYSPLLGAFSGSLFGNSSSAYIYYQNSGTCPAINTPGYSDAAPLCPEVAYAQDLTGKDNGNRLDYVKTITYGILFLVGVIAFLRGLVLLIKVGDGGQPGTLSKAVTHIIAGIVAVNAPEMMALVEGIASGLGVTTSGGI